MKALSKYKLFAAGIAVLASTAFQSQIANWPTIQPLHESRTFVNPNPRDDADSSLVVLVKNISGLPVYKIECHNGNYSRDSAINFSGEFQCALFAVRGSKIVSGNLLAASTPNEQSTDWWNRGRLCSAQFRGSCLAYPEYSTDRHFELRGMRLTLQFGDIEWASAKDQYNNPRLAKFEVTLEMVPDAAAKSATAELPPGPIPPRPCYP